MEERSLLKNDFMSEEGVWGDSGSLPPRGKVTFVADLDDSLFALFVLILGFFFARWVLFVGQGWGVSLFTLAYCASVTVYLLRKGITMPKEGWFWLIVVLLLGLSYSLWVNHGLAPWHGLLLFGSAVYWILSATGLLILGKTSDLILVDAYHALIVIPFSNFGCQYKSLAFLGRNHQARGKQLFPIALGLLLALIVMLMVLPLLLQADSGGFARIIEGLLNSLRGINAEFGELFWNVVLALPIAAYIFGLVGGSAHKRGTELLNQDYMLEKTSGLRVLPLATAYILLGLLCALYIVFIGSQLPYFFSAFVGERPEGWQIYSEYARSGFFELCRIAVINLVVLAAANIMSKKHSERSMVLKILNALLAFLTLVLIATAFSKMAMYIGAYGLSVRRLLPCVFMIFMAVVCGGVIALQKWSFSITRLAVGVGIVMFCLLALSNPDSFVARYNADRYLAGTLPNFDVEILYRSGPAGVDAALKVYDQSDDQALQYKLKEYLLIQQQNGLGWAGKPGGNWERTHARERITKHFPL